MSGPQPPEDLEEKKIYLFQIRRQQSAFLQQRARQKRACLFKEVKMRAVICDGEQGFSGQIELGRGEGGAWLPLYAFIRL